MHIFPVIIDKPFDRDEIRKSLQDKGIQTGIHYYPNHLLSYFFEESNSFLKNTEEIYSKLITLPLHPDLSIDDIKSVSRALKENLITRGGIVSSFENKIIALRCLSSVHFFNFDNCLQSKINLGNLLPLNAKSSKTEALVANPPFLVFFKPAILRSL